MSKRRHYAYLDTWVLSKLADDAFAAGLSRVLQTRRLVPISTSLSFVEIYNPGWANAPGRERGEAVAAFLADHPGVIVDPQDIFDLEYKHYPERLSQLPLRLDLATLEPSERRENLLQFLRRDETFLAIGKDIGAWAAAYAEAKAAWLGKARDAVEGVMRDNAIVRRPDGSVRVDPRTRDYALLSLDLRLADGADSDSFLTRAMRRRVGSLPLMRGCRTTSLAMWHLYAGEDAADRLAQKDSDVGDILHLALAPYCKLFTADATIHRALLRIAGEVGFDSGTLVGRTTLDSLIRRAPS